MPQVRVVPAKMAEHGVAMTDVMEAVSEALDEGILRYNQANYTGTGGFIDTPEPATDVRRTSRRSSTCRRPVPM